MVLIGHRRLRITEMVSCKKAEALYSALYFRHAYFLYMFNTFAYLMMEALACR